MSLAFNGSSALERFERGNAIETCNGIMFDFLPGTSTHTDSLTTHAVWDLRLDCSFPFSSTVHSTSVPAGFVFLLHELVSHLDCSPYDCSSLKHQMLMHTYWAKVTVYLQLTKGCQTHSFLLTQGAIDFQFLLNPLYPIVVYTFLGLLGNWRVHMSTV